MVSKPKLSIIILNYNTSELTARCVASIQEFPPSVSYEVIVVDNGSDEKLGEFGAGVTVIRSRENLGFARGNNLARKRAEGTYILFLNSDTEVRENTLTETVKYLDGHPEVGALTCKILLPDGGYDRDARRSFPTPWVALTHFSGLDRVFPRSKLLARYWYGFLDPEAEHEVDVLQGAYFLVRKSLLDKVGWFSEEYVMDGEDIDLSWKIKAAGYKIVYYPKVEILHIKKATKTKVKGRFVGHGVAAMEIFYRKFLWERYPWVVNLLVLLGVRVLRAIRSR